MMLPTAVFVPKRPTNEDEMLAAAYKDIYKQLRKNGELPDLTGGYEIDPQTGDYYSNFYDKRKVLGNPSSNLKPYTGGYLLTYVLDELTEDYQPLFDDQAPFGKKLEAQIYLVVRPAQAIGRIIKGVKRVGKGTGNVENKPKLPPLENGPYIKNGKPNGRPGPTGKAKQKFEEDVYNNQVDPDGVLRDPNTGVVIDWKPSQPRKGKVDFGHTTGNSYSKMFNKYKNREINLDELKEFQSNPKNFRLENPSVNRSHEYE